MLFGWIGLPVLAGLFVALIVPDTSSSATDIYFVGVTGVALWMSPWRELRRGRMDEYRRLRLDDPWLRQRALQTPERSALETLWRERIWIARVLSDWFTSNSHA